MEFSTNFIISNLYNSMMEFYRHVTESICALDVVLKEPIQIRHNEALISINKIQNGIFYNDKDYYRWIDFDWNIQMDIILKLAISYKIF